MKYEYGFRLNFYLMKKSLLLFVFIVFASILYGQKLNTIEYYNWSNSTAFKLTKSPIITGYGIYSDSLSKAYDGLTFYEYNGTYYKVENWADYYFWYVNKYWWQFIEPDLYEYFYYAGDDYGMVSYIASKAYRAEYYPSEMKINMFNNVNNRLHNEEFLAVNEESRDKVVKNATTSNTQNYRRTGLSKPNIEEFTRTNNSRQTYYYPSGNTNNTSSGNNASGRRSTSGSNGGGISSVSVYTPSSSSANTTQTGRQESRTDIKKGK